IFLSFLFPKGKDPRRKTIDQSLIQPLPSKLCVFHTSSHHRPVPRRRPPPPYPLQSRRRRPIYEIASPPPPSPKSIAPIPIPIPISVAVTVTVSDAAPSPPGVILLVLLRSDHNPLHRRLPPPLPPLPLLHPLPPPQIPASPPSREFQFPVDRPIAARPSLRRLGGQRDPPIAGGEERVRFLLQNSRDSLPWPSGAEFPVNVSIKKKKKKGSCSCLMASIVCSLMTLLQVVSVYLSPDNDDEDQNMLCTYPFLSCVLFGGFAAVYAVVFLIACWRVMAVVINKGMRRRIGALVSSVIVALSVQITCLILSCLLFPEDTVYGFLVLAMFIFVLGAMAIGDLILIITPITHALQLNPPPLTATCDSGGNYFSSSCPVFYMTQAETPQILNHHEVPQRVMQTATLPVMARIQGLQNLVSSMSLAKICQLFMDDMDVVLGSMVQGTAKAQRTCSKLKRVKVEHAQCRDRENVLASCLDEVGNMYEKVFNDYAVFTVEKDSLEVRLEEADGRHECCLGLKIELARGRDVGFQERKEIGKETAKGLMVKMGSLQRQREWMPFDADAVLKERADHPMQARPISKFDPSLAVAKGGASSSRKDFIVR
ncbi:hypothetical protein STAS_06035, partial [Striga asiatica]